MKKLLTHSLLFLVFISCFGNAGVFRGSGQTPTLEKTDTIQMVEEEIIMIPRRVILTQKSPCRRGKSGRWSNEEISVTRKI